MIEIKLFLIKPYSEAYSGRGFGGHPFLRFFSSIYYLILRKRLKPASFEDAFKSALDFPCCLLDFFEVNFFWYFRSFCKFLVIFFKFWLFFRIFRSFCEFLGDFWNFWNFWKLFVFSCRFLDFFEVIFGTLEAFVIF